MTVGELKKLLDYVDDETKVVVGCEGYSNYHFEENNYWDGEDGKIKLTKVKDVLMIHPRTMYPYDCR